MATARSITKKPKKKVVRGTPRIKRGAKLTEPSWEGWEEWTGEQFHRAAQHARDWYYQNYKPIDLYPAVEAWMSKNDYTPEQVKQVKAAPTHALSITAGITGITIFLCSIFSFIGSCLRLCFLLGFEFRFSFRFCL